MFIFKKEFSYDNILSPSEVKEKGIFLDDERFTYEDDYFERISYTDDNNVTAPFTGLCYWLYPNGIMHGYSFYNDGYQEGDEVYFYDNGDFSKYTNYTKDESRTLFIEWSKDGTVSRIEEMFNVGNRQKRFEYDIYGNITAQYDMGRRIV